MTMKRFLAPNLVALLILTFVWVAGFDTVYLPDDDHQTNLRKYLQVQRRIIDNYVDPVSIDKLYKSSIKSMVSNITDSTMAIKETPLDTTFGGKEITSLREAYEKFESAYLYLANNSPDENMKKRTEDAIKGIFEALDPHSTYIEPEVSEEIENEFEGKFQGIGIQFDIIQDTITVITAISGGPSDQLGIISGDRIIKIDGKSAIGFDNKKVIETLRGPKGSRVDVTIKRPGVKSYFNYTIERDDIPLYTVDTSYMLDDKTGFVKINRFAATTHDEFMEAMRELKDKGMERLILDLRTNPGGYLSQAIAIAEEFFPRKTELLSTKSRHSRFTDEYYSRKDGIFKDKPLIILVNQGSASASEIVSGAVQDHDRGLIVGQRTFGKGLVQQQYSLVDESNIRVTISRYYTPSGRLIQKPYKNGRQDYLVELYKREDNPKADVKEFISHIPDSLRFSTEAGRIVYGGGGIIPDKIIGPDTTVNASVYNYMRRKKVGFNFVRDYIDKHGDELRAEWGENFKGYKENFEWSEEAKTDLFERLKNSGMVVVENDTLNEPEFKNDSLYIPQDHYKEVEWMTTGYAKADMARQLWTPDKLYPIYNELFDHTLKKAMTFWDEVEKLEKIAQMHSGSELMNDIPKPDNN